MTEITEGSHIESRLRRYAVRAFQLFIVLCLADGFLDIIYPVAIFTKNHLIRNISESRQSESRAGEKTIIQKTPLPIKIQEVIRGIVDEYHSPNVNVNASGLRNNGNELTDKTIKSGFLLGSSAAFGLGVSDNQTISAHLERALDNIRIYNYSGIGQPLSDILLRWYDLQNKYGKPDFVILAIPQYELLFDCKFPPAPKVDARVNIIQFLEDKVSERFYPGNSHHKSCVSSQKNLELIVRREILDIENAVAFGRKQGIPFYVVSLPTPYDSDLNVDNLLSIASAKEMILLKRPVFNHYHQELTKLDLPEIIDLSHALPLQNMYFLDMGGHLSGETNRLIAEILARRIKFGRDPS